MPRNRSSQLVFVLVVLVLLGIIGRNLHQRSRQSELLTAIKENDVSAVRRLLEQGADPAHGRPPFAGQQPEPSPLKLTMNGASTSLGRQEIACLLIEHGAIAKTDTETLRLSLLRACSNGQVRVVRCLLEQGASALSSDRYGRNPLEMAISYRYNIATPNLPSDQWTPQQRLQVETSQKEHRATAQEIIRLLQAHGAQLTAWQAVRMDDIDTLHAALDAGARMDAPEGIGAATALTEAAQRGNLPMVRLLLQRGANANTATNPYQLPLIAAITGRHLEVARLLLERGADPSGRLQRSVPASDAPLVYACSFLPSLVPELLQRGADVEVQGGYALAAAINNRNPELVALLLKHRPSAWGPFGHAALIAAIHYRPDLVRLLLTQGADAHETPGRNDELISQCVRYDRKDLIAPLLRAGALLSHTAVASAGGSPVSGPGGPTRTHTTPLIEAIGQGAGMVKLLLELGADPNGMNDQGATPLIAAAQTGNVEATQLLLAHGVRVDNEGNTRHTPLYFARRHNHPEVVALLQQAGGAEE